MALTLSGSGITSANIVDGTITNTDISASANIPASKLSGTGKVLQVVSTTIDTVVSSASSDASSIGADVGLNVTITPTSSTSKFFITVNVGVGSTSTGNTWACILSRGGVKTGNGLTVGVRHGVLFRGVDHTGSNGSDVNHGVGGSGSYMDTTSGSAGTAITYKVGLIGESGNAYLNRVESDYGGGTVHAAATRTSSTITVMEIA